MHIRKQDYKDMFELYPNVREQHRIRMNIARLMLVLASVTAIGGCGTVNVQSTENVDATSETETFGVPSSDVMVGPELEAYCAYIFEGGYQGHAADRDISFPMLTGAKDASFLLRDIDGDEALELYLCGTIEDGETYFPAFCLLDYLDGEVQTLAEQYYQQKVKYSFLNNDYLCRYEEGAAESPHFYREEELNGYDPEQDEWVGYYSDLTLWSPDPDKEEVHLVYESGGFRRDDQYVVCPYFYLFNDEKVTEEEYDALESQYTENAQIPVEELQPLSRENLLKALPQAPADALVQEKPDLQVLLLSIEGDYTDSTDPEYLRNFYIGRDGMNWFGGYPVTSEDVVDYGPDYVVFQCSEGSYYKVTITEDALFISYGSTPAALNGYTVIDRNTRQPL